MRTAVILLTLGLLGFAWLGLANAIKAGDNSAQIVQLRAQLAQIQRAEQQAQTQFVSERAAFVQAEARIGGTHRDLITCGDWQTMFLPVSGTDSFNGQIAASAGPPPLPQHCVNQ